MIEVHGARPDCKGRIRLGVCMWNWGQDFGLGRSLVVMQL